MADSATKPPPEPSVRRSAPAFSRQQLAAAARQRLERQNAPAPARRRLAPWRIGLWVVEAGVLLTLLEVYVLRPLQARRAPSPPPSAALALPAPLEAVPPLAEKARALPGLNEVVPAHFAPLEGLAAGSETMRSAQQSYSLTAALPVEVENTLGMRFRLVPPGTAIIGSPAEEVGRGDRELQHVVACPEPFYLGRCEVSQAEWVRLVPENPAHGRGPDHPVEEVTWYDCQRFLAALNRLEGLPEGTYRLPTESEWEYACRAGTATAYCCGNDPRRLDRFAIHGENSGGRTAPVGSRRPNALGLYDLHGNVWEWCLNRFGPYPNDDRPIDPEHESWRCLRGGNWYVPPVDCRSAGRNRLPPASKGNMLGFRVLRAVTRLAPASAPPPPPPAPETLAP